MGERSVAIRILGFASTTRGFAFALTEGSECLVDWGSRQTSSRSQLVAALDTIIKRGRPLFVAAEIARTADRSDRGRLFVDTLKSVCAVHDLMILCVERSCVDAEGRTIVVTNHDLAKAVAERFDAIAGKLPRRRRL